MSLITVSADSTVTSPSACSSNKFYVDHGNGKYTCADTLGAAVTAIGEDETNVEIVLVNNHEINSLVPITKDVTINLNGKKLTIAESDGELKIQGANVTIKNGTLDVTRTSSHAISVDSTNDESALTVNATVKSKTSAAVVKVTNATNTTVVNVNGTWTVAGELVDCDNAGQETLTVNLNVNATGDHVLVSIDSGTSTVNVQNGSYTSKDGNVFELKSGTLNISGGTILAKKGSAVYVTQKGTERGANNTLKITNGTLKSEATYALNFVRANKGDYSIANGTFESGKDDDKKQLPAIGIVDFDFLNDQKNMISGGKFIGAVVGEVGVGTDTYQTSASATKMLVGNATVSEKDGVVI